MQVVKHDVIETVHEHMFEELVDAQKSPSGDDELTDNIPDDYALVKHHHIALDQHQAVYLREWLSENRDDPAFKVRKFSDSEMEKK